MTIRPLYGHATLLNRLEGALTSGRFPQTALLVGPAGVGKQRIALWLAQALLCDQGPGRPCGTCRECHQVEGLSHPDLHWFVPIGRPKAGDADKQVEEVRTLLAEAMAERRDGLTPPLDGMASHPLASIRLLLRTVALKPFRGPRRIVILGDAERLVVQEASQEAANALLKVLEEPPAGTTFVLTAAEPQSLLPTIRSRVVPVRVAPAADEDVAGFLQGELDPAPSRRALANRVALAEGSIGRALWQAGGEDAAGRAASAFLDAVRGGPGAWSAAALAQAPWSARGGFSAMLDALATTLRQDARIEAEQGEVDRVARRVQAMRRIEEARADAMGNLNPQLAMAGLARDLEPLL